MNYQSLAPVVRHGAGCMIMCRVTGRFLMCKRSAITPFPHTWATWGGKAELGETPEQTAIREVFEETGCRIEGEVLHVFHFDMQTFSFHTFLAVVEDEFVPHINNEAEEAVWMTLEDIPENVHDGLRATLEDKMTVTRLVKYVENISGRPCSFDDIYRG